MFVHPMPRARRRLFDSMIYFNRSFATSERDRQGVASLATRLRCDPSARHERAVTEVTDAHGARDLDRSVEAAR